MTSCLICACASTRLNPRGTYRIVGAPGSERAARGGFLSDEKVCRVHAAQSVARGVAAPRRIATWNCRIFTHVRREAPSYPSAGGPSA